MEKHIPRLIGPAATPEYIDSIITNEHYFTAASGVEGEQRFGNPQPGDPQDYHESLKTLTFCVLTLENGFVVTGEAFCASPGDFDHERGRETARRNAISKIWPLEHYLQKQRAHDQ